MFYFGLQKIDPNCHCIKGEHYSLDLFVNQTLASKYLCAICMCILEEPTDINCGNGHLFCRPCLNQLCKSSIPDELQLGMEDYMTDHPGNNWDVLYSVFADQNMGPIPCPVCGEPTEPPYHYHESEQFVELQEQIDELHIFCPNHLKRSQLSSSNSNHAESIRNGTFDCEENDEDYCQKDDIEDDKAMEEEIQENELNKNDDKSNMIDIENAHFTSNSNSSKRSRHFPRSTNSRSRSRSRDRNSNSNSSRRRSSTNKNNINGCLWRGQLKELDHHLRSECDGNIVQCEYLKYGCTANIKMKDRDLHNKKKKSKHIQLKMNALERKLEDQSKKIELLGFVVERAHPGTLSKLRYF